MPPQDPNFGPFTDILTTPLYQQSGVPQTTSGLGGKGENALFFVDKFLEGAQRGRQMAFERHEGEQRQLYNSILDAYSRVDQADIPSDVKEQARGKLDALRIGILAKHVDSHTGKGGKGQQDSPQHRMLNFVKSGLDAMVGPRPKQYEMGQEQVNAGLASVFSDITDPKNNVQNRISKLTGDFTSTYNAVKGATGRDLTQNEVLMHPAMSQQLTHITNLTGGKLPINVATTLAGLESGTRESQLDIQAKEASIEEHRAAARLHDIQAKQGYFTPMQTEDGIHVSYDQTTGEYRRNGKVVDPNTDPELKGKQLFEKPQTPVKWQLVHNSNPPQIWNPTTGQTKPFLDAQGNQVKITDPLYRQMYIEGMREGFRDYETSRTQLNATNAQIAGIVKSEKPDKPLTPEETKQLEVLKKQRDILDEDVKRGYPHKAGAVPDKKPKAGKEETPKPGSAEDKLNRLMGGGGAATPAAPEPAAGSRPKSWADQQ